MNHCSKTADSNCKNCECPKESHIIEGKSVTECDIKLCEDDVFIAMSDSTTAEANRVRNCSVANVLFGPPANPEGLTEMLTLFFKKQGYHIVSGGTTSTIAAEFLGKELITSIDYIDPDVPPTARIEGVDLVTEGVLTINKVLEYAKDYNGENKLFYNWHKKNDGASQIARMLFDYVTDINFYVGRAINPTHQNPDLPIGFNIKMQLITELCENLKTMGKKVSISYF